MTFDPYDNSCSQINEAYAKAKAARYEPITMLKDIQKQVAKSSLKPDEYSAISARILELKQLLYERL